MALLIHALSLLVRGAVEILGISKDNYDLLKAGGQNTTLFELWEEGFGDIVSPTVVDPAHRRLSIPIFARATGGHALHLIALERMCLT